MQGEQLTVESMSSAGLVTEAHLMPEKQPRCGDPLGPLDFLKLLPHEAASSDRLGWVGLQAAHCRAAPAFELELPVLTHHRLFLFSRPPDELDLHYEGVKRNVPPPAGSVSLLPAGSPARVRSSGCKDELHIFLEPRLVAQVAAEAFDLDPARLMVPPLDGLDLPQLRVPMLAVGAELTAGAGGPLAAESLANVLAVHVIRHVLTPRQPARRRVGTLPRAKLRAVVEYIEEHLDGSPTLEQLAAVARLSPNYFVGQFKRATGVPPHQYVILRRVERARRLLQTGTAWSLPEVAAHAGFSDQSQFSHHFKRVVGVTPGQFRTRVRTDKTA
jgi:AraC family transcriptional regulator